MTPLDAVLAVLDETAEPLHWTVIQDLALRRGFIDPFEVRDVRGEVQRALRELAGREQVERVSPGVWRRRR